MDNLANIACFAIGVIATLVTANSLGNALWDWIYLRGAKIDGSRNIIAVINVRTQTARLIACMVLTWCWLTELPKHLGKPGIFGADLLLVLVMFGLASVLDDRDRHRLVIKEQEAQREQVGDGPGERG